MYNTHQDYNFSYQAHHQALPHTVRKPTYWVSMCVMCAASIPKHFPFKCPTEKEDSALIWPSICFKCRPFVPIHDHENCPNAKAFTSSTTTVDNFSNYIEPEIIKVRKPPSLPKRNKKFRVASDESVHGTTFYPQKTRKTFVQKQPTDLFPQLPPIHSFLQSNDAEKSNNNNAADSFPTDETSDYTLPLNNATQKVTYTTKLNFNDLEEKQNTIKQVLRPRKVVKKKMREKRANLSPMDSESLVLENDDKSCNLVKNHQYDTKMTIWNDLSSILSTDNANNKQGFVKMNEKENFKNDPNKCCAIPKAISQRLVIKSITMGSDSEVDLYSSNDEEDVLINQSISRKIRNEKPCSLLQIESPESLSKKVLSCITPIDEAKRYDLSFKITNNLKTELSLKQSKDRVRKPKKSHQVCNGVNKNSFSIIDSLELSPC